MEWRDEDWIRLVQDGNTSRAVVKLVVNTRVS
jgi:hypothetical protein